jgi:hypothetical protein
MKILGDPYPSLCFLAWKQVEDPMSLSSLDSIEKASSPSSEMRIKPLKMRI